MIYQHREHYEGCKRKACDRAHHQTAAKLINNISTAARSRLRTANCTTNEERTQEEFLQKRLQTSISPRHTCTQRVARSEAITRKVSASKTAERRIFSFRSSSSTSSDYTDVVWLTSYSIQEQVLQVRSEPQALNWGFSAVSRTHHRHHLFCQHRWSKNKASAGIVNRAVEQANSSDLSACASRVIFVNLFSVSERYTRHTNRATDFQKIIAKKIIAKKITAKKITERAE